MSIYLLSSASESAIWCFQHLFWVSVIGGLVVIAALIVQASLSRYVKPKWMHLFWLVVAARFLLFIVPASPTSVLNLFDGVSQTRAVASQSNERAESTVRAHVFNTPVASSSVGQPRQVVGQPELKGSKPAADVWAGYVWLLFAFVWLLVLVVLLIRLLRGLFLVRRIVALSSDPPIEIAQRYEQLRIEAKVRDSVQLKVTDEIEAPVSVGIFMPVVLLPTWCLSELDAQQQDFILAHELVHISRHDTVTQVLTHLAAMVHWFNPLVWLASGLAEQYRELSCDQRVLDLFPGSERSYRQTIVQVAVQIANTKQIESAFVGRFVNLDSKLVKQRIAMLTKRNSHPPLGGIVAAVALVFMVAVGFTDAQEEQLSKAQTAEPIPAEGEIFPQPQGLGPVWTKPMLPHVPIDFSRLRQDKPEFYTLDADDVLGVFIEEVLGEFGTAPPVQLPDPNNDLPPAIGFPVPVREDGTMSLPLVSPIPVRGLTVQQAEALITRAYRQGDNPILIDKGRIIVTLIRKRFSESGPIRLVVGQTSTVASNGELIGASFNDPEIVTATIGEENKLEFLAMVPGKTVAMIELPGKRVQPKQIIAVPDVSELQAAIAKEFPGLAASIYGTPEGDAVIAGHLEKKLAAKVVGFAKTKTELPVRNLTTDKQVAIKVWIYEVDISKLKDAGLPDSNTSVVPFVLEGQKRVELTHFSVGPVLNAGFMDTLAKRDVAKLLDQPVLVAAHKQKAEFVSGGEFPTMVLDENGNKKVDFRFAGTKLEITPQIRSKEDLVLELNAEFSQVDPELSPAEGVPGFRVRRMSSGQLVKPGSRVGLVSVLEEGKELVMLVEPKLIKLQQVDDIKPALR